jgi:hypothetical protein
MTLPFRVPGKVETVTDHSLSEVFVCLIVVFLMFQGLAVRFGKPLDRAMNIPCVALVLLDDGRGAGVWYAL